LGRTRYPSYDVLKEKERWDDHTRQIVLQRLGPFPANRCLTGHEAELVAAIARHVVYDHREDILAYVVHHLDGVLSSPVGEGQRLAGTPERKVLLREGLAALDELCQRDYEARFLALDEQRQSAVLAGVHLGQPPYLDNRRSIPAKEFFKKLATEIVSAYYSHPAVWSEIGYGGPAYPRGYVRVEKGLTDPWEAKRHADEE